MVARHAGDAENVEAFVVDEIDRLRVVDDRYLRLFERFEHRIDDLRTARQAVRTRNDVAAHEFGRMLLPDVELHAVVAEPVDRFTGNFGIGADEFRIGTTARNLHHVVEIAFDRILFVRILVTRLRARNPARAVGGRAVRTAHLFNEHDFRAPLLRFQGGTKPRKARADDDDVPVFAFVLAFLLERRLRGRRHGRRSRSRRCEQTALEKVSPCLLHGGSPFVVLRFGRSDSR